MIEIRLYKVDLLPTQTNQITLTTIQRVSKPLFFLFFKALYKNEIFSLEVNWFKDQRKLEWLYV